MLAACLVLTAHAQNASYGSVYGSVRGGRVPLPSDEISPQERARIKALISGNVDALQRSGRLPVVTKRTPTKSLPAVLFQWPLQMVPGHPEPAPRNVIAFVDHDPNYPNQVLDYACGTRSYDTPDGYNHQGTDITSYPFMQRKQNNDETIVVAAAPGVIVAKEDGQPDHSCSLNMNPWNAVYVHHSDGSEAWYGHLKANSLTTKNVGDSVDAGEFLGVMGSSGDSTGPHLHFEVYDANGQLVDPFAGTCNDFNTFSWWANQRPYYEPAIDLVTTGNAPVDFLACPAPEIENRSSYYQPGQTVYITAFLTDQLRPNSTTFSVYTPTGTLAATTTVPSDSDFYSASYWEWSFPLPSSAVPGVWAARVDFAGQSQIVEFQVGASEPPRAEAIEYYNASLDHYFMTSFANEIAILDAGVTIRGWTRTGGSFPTYSAPDPDLDTVCRFYGTPGLGENTHFYTAFSSECATLQQNPLWAFEADAFFIALPDNMQQCQPSTRPVFRLYNQGLGGTPNHRYTTSWPVVNLMQSKGWALEGVVMCTPL